MSQIKLNGEKIDISRVDIKKIDVKVSIEIVDKFNHALVSIGGIPAYIDRSYLANETSVKFQTILDTVTKEPFFVYTTPILDSSNNFIGVVLSGNSLKQVKNDLRNQLIFLTVSGIAVIVFIVLTMAFVFQRQLISLIKKPKEVLAGLSDKNISNNPQEILEVDQKNDGSVVVNFQDKQYRISRPEFDSESDQLFGRLMDIVLDSKEINYDVMNDHEIKLNTPLSRIVTRLGFKGMIRDIFFPRTAKQSLHFRRYLTQEDLVNMGLSVDQVFSELTKIAST